MIRRTLGRIMTLWRSFKFARYSSIHLPLGGLNYTVAFVLFSVYGVNHHLATAAGHFLHTGLGFFLDRDVIFQSPHTTVAQGVPRYLLIDVLVYGSIMLSMYTMVDWLNFGEYKSRALIAMPIGTLLHYFLNKHWTFGLPSPKDNVDKKE